jgi:adenosylcobinamide-GDP ribazoletransferase
VEVSNGAILRLCLIPVISRSFGALSSLLFPAAGANGLLGTFQTNASKGWTLGLISLVAAAALGGMTYLGRAPGAAAGIAALLLFAILRGVAKKQFSGMSGDLAGWYITLSELMMLAALVIVEKAVIL